MAAESEVRDACNRALRRHTTKSRAQGPEETR
jgi:hypothetical protein